MPATTPRLFMPPSRDTARVVLPRAEHTEQPKILILQTIHFYSPKCSTCSFWREKDSWLKSNEEKPGGIEAPQLQPGARRGRGKVSPAESPAQQRSLPACPVLFSHSPCMAAGRAPGQPAQRCPAMCFCAFSRPRTIPAPNRRRTNHCVRNNKYPVPYPASLLFLKFK